MTARRAVWLVAALAIAGLDTRASNGSAGLTAECTVEALQARAPHGTTITAAAMVPSTATLPEYCRVDGHVAAPGNEVNFRLGLPVNWNGKYYFFGVGGLGGTIGSLDAGLTRGYASASTDTGHSSSDPSWAIERAPRRSTTAIAART